MTSTHALQFRRATPEDAPEIVALVNACYRGDSSRVGWTTEADLLDGTRTDDVEITKLITNPDSMILVCTNDDEIIGSVNIEKQNTSSYLGMLVVKPGLQGSGIGRQLIDVAERQARAAWGSSKMTMNVITVRPELLAYYERRGYRRTGQIQPFAFDDVHGMLKVDRLELEVLEKDLQ
jgi:ribosomal protein S18 acetylase RimI-like enzyme